MPCRIWWCYASLALVVALFMQSPAVLAQPRPTDEEAIRSAAKQYLAALDRKDAQALLAFWMPEGDVIDESGKATPARDVIESEVKKEGPRPDLKLVNSTIRFLTPEAAIEDGEVETAPGKDGGTARRGRFTAAWVKHEGKWRLASLRELRAAPSSALEDLASLDWMTGHWVGDAGQVKFEISTRWSPRHTYLLREVTVTDEGKPIHSASQRIGWDPATGKIVSWAFDDDGGHSESTWTRQGDRWIVQTRGVLPDGKSTSSTNIFTPESKDACVWKSTARVSNGRSYPDQEVKLVRASGRVE